MIKLRGKKVLLIALVALLCVACYLNYGEMSKTKMASEDDNPLNAELVSSTGEDDIMNGKTKINSDFFTTYRMEREKLRGENIEELKSITTDEKVSSENKNVANTQMMELIRKSEDELLIENLIKSKGYRDCIVFIHEGYINIVLDSEELTQAQAIQIQDLVATKCKVELSKIAIAINKAK